MRILFLMLVALTFVPCCSQPTEFPKPRASARGSSTTDQPTLDQLKSRADKLLAQMASPDYKTREKATKVLRTLLKEDDKNQQDFLQYLDKQLIKINDPDMHHRLGPILDRYLRPWKCFIILHILKEDLHAVCSLSYTSDSRLLLSGGANGEIFSWNSENGELLKTTYNAHDVYVGSLSISPNGKMLASASGDRRIRIWHLINWECTRVIKSGRGGDFVAFSPNGKFVAGGFENNICLWDIKTGEQTALLQGHRAWAECAAFSPDGKLLASGSSNMRLGFIGGDSTICLWNVADGKCLHTLKEHHNSIRSLAFSPDGRLLASASVDKTIRIWNPETGECLRTLEKHTNYVNSVAFSPDGKMLVSGSRDGIVYIWNPHNGKCLRALKEHQDSVNCVVFNPDGKSLASASWKTGIIIWGIPEE